MGLSSTLRRVTEVRAPGAAPLAITGSSGGADWQIELDRTVFLPGRVVGGRISVKAGREIEARALVVALIAEEHWRHTETRQGPNNTTTSEVVTSTEELLREPVMVHGALHLGAGETWTGAFEQPVPAMGPATLEAEDAGLEWTFEAKLDIPGDMDSRVDRAIVVAQPTALLRAGAVHVGEFALYESVDITGDGVTASIKLEPMPLACGEPFSGRVELSFGEATKLQEIRAELRVDVEATVSSGESEEITAWSGVLAPAGTYEGTFNLDVTGRLEPRPLPTIELPHGRAQATFRVILARAWAMDAHLVRDVALATTTEL